MNKLWAMMLVIGFSCGCSSSAEKKEIESVSASDKSEVIVDKEVEKNYEDALKDYKHYDGLKKSIAYKGDKELIQAYSDSALSSLFPSKIGNYSFVDIAGDTFNTAHLSKPLYLTTSASWCKPCIAKIPALNAILDEYKNKVDFVILFQDTEDVVIDMSHDYHKAIRLVPSLTQDRYQTWRVSDFEPLPVFPTTYLIARDKLLFGMGQGAEMARTFETENFEKIIITKEDAYNKNIESLHQDMAKLLDSN